MMGMGGEQGAWSRYREALAAVVPETRERLEALATGEVLPDEEAVDVLIERSDELRLELEKHLVSDDLETRQLAALQLNAAAALDVQAANRITELEPAELGGPQTAAPEAAGFETAPEADLSATDVADLERLLSVPTQEGIDAVVGPEDLPASAAFAEAAADPAALKSAVQEALDKILSEAAKTTAKAVEGLAAIPGDALLDGASKALGPVFDLIGDKAKFWIKKAIRLVLRAIEKLLSIFGTKADDVRKKVAGWVKGLDADHVKPLLERLYDVKGIRDALDKQIDEKGGTVSPERLEAAVKQVSQLAARVDKQLDVVRKLMWVLGKVRGWLVKLSPPSGLIGVTAFYLLVVGYAIYACGDYVDWRQGGALDFVDGVRHAVDGAFPVPV